MPNQFVAATCCWRGALWISWEKPPKDWREGEGPEEEGWAMPVAERCQVNVTHCPFCGKKLEK